MIASLANMLFKEFRQKSKDEYFEQLFEETSGRIKETNQYLDLFSDTIM